MSMVSLSTPLVYPETPDSMNAAPSYTNLLLNSLTAKVAFVFDAPKTGTITNIHWRVGSVTTGTTGEVRLETIDLATGRPSGTLVGTDTYVTFGVPTRDLNRTETFIAGASVTKGQRLAVVIQPTGVTVPNWNINAFPRSGTVTQYPFPVRHTTAWQTPTPYSLVMAVGYSDGTYPKLPQAVPTDSSVNVTSSYNTNTNPDHEGVLFTMPFRCRVSGAWFAGETDGDCALNLYAADGYTVLASRSIDAEEFATAGTGVFYIQFNDPVTIEPGVGYRLALVPTTTTSILLHQSHFASEAIKQSAWYVPDGWQRTRHNNTPVAGSVSWSNTSVECPWMGLLIDQVDVTTTIGEAYFG